MKDLCTLNTNIMFCLKKALHQLNNIHERSLHLKHQYYVSNFITFLVNANEKSTHQKCLDLLIIEIYKYLNGLPPQIMNDIFKLRKNIYNLRNVHLFESLNPRTKRYGLDGNAYRV